jgi:hypothetical protein
MSIPSGTFTTIGSATAPGIGTAIGGVLDLGFNIFGGDKGHYENGRFVPGDLQSRIAKANARIISFGLSPADVDENVVNRILYVESGWQGNLDNYLYSIIEAKKKGTFQPPSSNQNNLDESSDSSEDRKKASTDSLVVLGLLGAGLFMLK